MRKLKTGIALYLAAAATVSLCAASAATAATTYEKSLASPGSGAGQLNNPSGVAVDDGTGSIYVSDRGNNRVQMLDSTGAFVLMWGNGVNQTTGGDICTAVSGDVCKAGTPGGGGGEFSNPQGIAVDNSGGAADGSVYVQDAGNNRIQRFTSTGAFVLTWGRNVNIDTGGDFCTAASGDDCKAGNGTGSNTPPDSPGGFRTFPSAEFYGIGPSLGVDGSGNVYAGDPGAKPQPRVQKFSPGGVFIGQIFGTTVINEAPKLVSLSVNSAGDAYVATVPTAIARFAAEDFTPAGDSAVFERIFDAQGTSTDGPRRSAIDPASQFLFVIDRYSQLCPGSGATRIREFDPDGEEVDCSAPGIGLSRDAVGGLAVSQTHRLYVTDSEQGRVRVFTVPTASAPTIDDSIAHEVTADSARIDTEIAANLKQTTFHVEYGAVPCSVGPCQSTDESDGIGTVVRSKAVSRQLEGLSPDTTYYYRVVATNSEGTTAGPDHQFNTFPVPVPQECANLLARQQTGAGFLLDCRAYELVSAEDTGGYDVATDLIPGHDPFGGFPHAHDKVLYAIHNGAVPGTGNPTNRGPDPYVATRDPANKRWRTEYFGIPADAPSAAPFSSSLAGADDGLKTMAFSGPDLCDPCFADGSSGIPVRAPSGELVQGMAGSIPVEDPEPAGVVRKHLSGDGTHLVFGSEQQFEPEGNSGGGDVTIYSRDLDSGTTEVVSTLPDGSTIAAGDDVVALDVSEDGSRVLVGRRVFTDGEDNDHFDLFLHEAGSPESIEIADTASGALFAGMTSDGSQVLFTTADPLAGDGDTSVDLFRATIDSGAATVTRVSTGTGVAGDTDACDPSGNSLNDEDWNVVQGGPTDCSVVAVGGGGGVAPGTGVVYFLSPEKLDGDGDAGSPNLFVAAPGGEPRFVSTLESSATSPLLAGAHVFEKSFASVTNGANGMGVAADVADGSFYVLDLNNSFFEPTVMVHKYDSQGDPVSGFAGDGTLNDSGDGPNSEIYGLTDGSIFGLLTPFPTTVAVNNNSASSNYRDLYVPDILSGIKRFSPSGDYEETIPVSGDPEFPLQVPVSVAISPVTGLVYGGTYNLSGAGNGFIQIWDTSGSPTKLGRFEIGGGGPTSIAIDSADNIFVANTFNVSKYDAAGNFVSVVDPGPAYAVSVDPTDDHLYVNRGDRIVEYDATGAQVQTPFGIGDFNDSLGVAAASGHIAVFNREKGSVLLYTPPKTPPSRNYDHPLVVHSLEAAETRHSADLQTNVDGRQVVFPSLLSLTGFPSSDRYQLFRYDLGDDEVSCVSCSPSDVAPTADSTLATDGLSLTDDGRVFFTSRERFAQRDTNGKKDAYEWSAGKVELISTGTSPFDSGILSATADGVDAFFFTRDTLAANDRNGSLVKIYDAREGGGYFFLPPVPQCSAADECHGQSSPKPAPPEIGTITGSHGNFVKEAPAKCKHGFVRKGKKCVKKHKKRGTRNRRGNQKQGGRR